jgi:hypothetical protein
MSSTRTKILRRHRKTLAGAVAAVAAGGLLAGCGSSTSSTTTANPSNAAATAPSASSGQQQGVPPGMGTTVRGAAADKAKAAATAKYPGTVERVMQLPDGSYEVHVITKSGGEVHVKVSKAFQVTGTHAGPPAGATPPAGSAPPASNGTTTTQSS